MCFIMWTVINNRVFHALSNLTPIDWLNIVFNSREHDFVFCLIYPNLILKKKLRYIHLTLVYKTSGKYLCEWKMNAGKVNRPKCTIQWLIQLRKAIVRPRSSLKEIKLKWLRCMTITWCIEKTWKRKWLL